MDAVNDSGIAETDLRTKARDLEAHNRTLVRDLDKQTHIKDQVYRKSRLADFLLVENRRLEQINTMYKDALVMIALGEGDDQAARNALTLGEWMRE